MRFYKTPNSKIHYEDFYTTIQRAVLTIYYGRKGQFSGEHNEC